MLYIFMDMGNKEKLVEQYDSNYKETVDKILQFYPPFFDNPVYDDDVKAEVLLIGDHQARHNDLITWRKDVQFALKELSEAKLWTKEYSNFEDILDEIKDVLPIGTKYIGDLARYDMAIRLASRNLAKLAPNDVYLHNGTLEGAKIWEGNDVVKKYGKIVKSSIFDDGLSKLLAYHIEVFLCVMHSSGIKSLADLENRNLDLDPIFKPEDFGNGKKKKNHFRRNLLAHYIFELGMGNDEAKRKSNFWK